MLQILCAEMGRAWLQTLRLQLLRQPRAGTTVMTAETIVMTASTMIMMMVAVSKLIILHYSIILRSSLCVSIILWCAAPCNCLARLCGGPPGAGR